MFSELNRLAEYGQMDTPPPGSQITKIEVRDDEHNGIIERMKDRFVWMPLHDVDFLGKLIHQPLSFTRLIRGRIHWVQSVAYKQVDNSHEAFDQVGDEDAPLRSFVCTPFAQCVYLYTSYGQKGLRVFEHLTGKNPQLVAKLEQIILPEVSQDLITMAKYLSEESPKNISAANLDYDTLQLAQRTLSEMMNGVSDAIKYCRELIKESEAEILTRHNQGWGKAHLDQNDRYAYIMTRKQIPAEKALDDSPDKRTNQLLEKFVDALTNVKNPTQEVAEKETPAAVSELQSKLDELQKKFDMLIAIKTPGEPSITPDASPVSKADAEAALKDKLNSTKRK